MSLGWVECQKIITGVVAASDIREEAGLEVGNLRLGEEIHPVVGEGTACRVRRDLP